MKESLEETMDKHDLNYFEWNGDLHTTHTFFKLLNSLKGNRLIFLLLFIFREKLGFWNPY